jgi:serine/threonine protein kinase
MPLSLGDKLGPYEVLAPIGAGGMGEVYKARDTRLYRIVAIKVSKTEFSERFEREARAVAALSHPNICTLHDVGPDYLVMEYIEGQQLKGPLPLEKALDYGAQILNALDAAHSKGITHRDLKPANILVTKQGIKLLDFGLAKQTGPVNETDLTQALTQQGAIVGTLNYMSPEQLQSKEADARSDLFSFGLVLYEMLTGKRAFSGSSAASVIAAILERPAPSILTIASPALDKVLQTMLAKDPDQRWQSARDLNLALSLAKDSQPASVPPPRSPLSWIAAAVIAIAGGIAFWMLAHRTEPATRMAEFKIAPPTGVRFGISSTFNNAISPDGKMIAFTATGNGRIKLWIRPLDSVVARELPGTDGAVEPFWSPDSQSIGFFSGDKLLRTTPSGNQPTEISRIALPRGASWNGDSVILFSTPAGLSRVPASGGTPQPVTKIDFANGADDNRWPQFLPDGKRFLFHIGGSKPHVGGTYLGWLDDSHAPVLLIENPTVARFAPAPGGRGYLVWAHESVFTAQGFDVGRARMVGEPLAITGIALNISPGQGVAGFSLSDEGTLVTDAESNRYQLTWFDHNGKVLATVGEPDAFLNLRISPDGNRAAVSLADPRGNRDAWLFDLARGIRSRLTSDNHGYMFAWSPDSQRLVLVGPNQSSAVLRNANGTGTETPFFNSPGPLFVSDWSPDGKFLLYSDPLPSATADLMLLPVTGEQKPLAYVVPKFQERHGQFSPDGNWVAYASLESGRYEIYVQSYPSGKAKFQVTKDGGAFPRSRRDSKELFYFDGANRIASVPLRQAKNGFEFGEPSAIVRGVEPTGPFAFPYDVAPDGKRVLALAPSSGPSAMTVVINWQEKLKR